MHDRKEWDVFPNEDTRHNRREECHGRKKRVEI